MRIIAGDAKGRPIAAPSGNGTRPTSDKLRGALFNILYGRVLDSNVLDLFGGTGALALEAISRGASAATIVEKNPAAARIIERNALNVVGESYSERVRIIKGDYASAIGCIRGNQFDIIFIDPPYHMLDAYTNALERLRQNKCLASGAVIVLERQKDAAVILPEGFICRDTRVYGETAVDFVEEGMASA